MNKAFLLLGSNIGNKAENLFLALTHIENALGQILVRSSLYETEPWGVKEQDIFVNQVIYIETTFNASLLLENILEIEKKMGRKRVVKWGERLIDIDILYFNEEIEAKKELKIPHPEIQNRRFTLIPLAEIAPNYKHPVLNLTNEELLNRCDDTSVVKRYLEH